MNFFCVWTFVFLFFLPLSLLLFRSPGWVGEGSGDWQRWVGRRGRVACRFGSTDGGGVR